MQLLKSPSSDILKLLLLELVRCWIVTAHIAIYNDAHNIVEIIEHAGSISPHLN